MLLTLAIVLWITIVGANKPSSLIAAGLFFIEDKLTLLFQHINAPDWLHGLLIQGMYRTLAWVLSVMLPPMAIFFPLFTILEDLGYLPRVAFNMDHLFKKACAHGKQCLTMCMGFGCNAAGIIACRIIESPRERLIATLTNNFVPCNGRFPTLIAIATVFLVTSSSNGFNILPVFAVTGLIIIGIMITLLVSYGLSKTILKGIPSTFTLELPPYRVPKIGRVLYTSIIDRTMFVLWRAVVIAVPAGALTWILGNVYIGDLSIIGHIAAFLDPFSKVIGLDGFILMAFILGLPANEIVLPILMMAYLSTGSMIEFESLESLKTILLDHGWTSLTALNVMLFSLLHWPCATTIITINKETKSLKWTALSILIPTVIAISVCFITTSIYKLIHLIF
jgi:ferrous iron transport protein B